MKKQKIIDIIKSKLEKKALYPEEKEQMLKGVIQSCLEDLQKAYKSIKNTLEYSIKDNISILKDENLIEETNLAQKVHKDISKAIEEDLLKLIKNLKNQS